ncbi:MAG: hypothetical protein UV74_C0013G0265 [Candidatus Woesebacteria bacterium GW2011_GWB1_43_14]|uniref:POTRA domain-containing protein n=1 Tax=Candidatus Woesebacteria bacterium GW2011_GWB1_43_14 TaxID=1618578 RepID=A0A0G1GE51_9BACT|nr:MAG: hypothetical protein UT21_C0002G0028 [Candidatus Woesebacteria bacterium GW2011_GWA1_39_11b]KKS78441.1 MAG: hypothetical protein UV51_C0001G0157 [Candidatus Woesebacteria bacterium GW2011_GWC1_42_9]KKS97143.1 MAG: hypothetical protein UV74_C0013G0265 [Candidatus Woesebacteria bacterium GW2011_GWB1_43_14]
MLGLCFGIVIFIVLMYLKVIKIREIECVSQYGLCPSAVNAQLDSYVGLNIRDAKKRIYEYIGKEGSIKGGKVAYKAPFQLVVYITEKKPGVALFMEGQDYIIVDPEGSVIGTSPTTDLPKLSITQTGYTKDQLEFASNLYYEFSRLHPIEFSELGDKDMIVKIAGGVKVIFPLEGDIDVLLGSLRLILSQLNNDEREIRIGSIDLRFENPVLR